ncbi:MAG: PorT family protein [Saprospiraceae bacterium]|nr:PorT family protein [Saprospiraceae bacterium]
MKRTLLLLCFFSISFLSYSQDIGYGFKAGLNFNRFIGPLEEDAQGASLEELVGNSGFHVGAIFNFKFSKEFGARAEILYSQKGGRYRYDGPSYFTLYNLDAEPIKTTGNRKVSLNVTMSYVDIPIGAYYKIFDWLEVSAGGNIGILAGATGAGQVTYSGISENSGTVPEFSITLDYDYRRDETGVATFVGGTPFLKVDGEEIEIPVRSGAYYEYPKLEDPYFSLLDLGVYTGVSLYLNKGFFLGLRANYGLADITNNGYDFSLQSLDANGERIPRSDKDVNFSIQTSLGFSF